MRDPVSSRRGGGTGTRPPNSVSVLVDALLQGDKRAAAKLISLIEDDEPTATEAVARIYPRTGHAHMVGFTGSPGVGKSSLINRLVRAYRARGKTVGVVAVDPTSPYSGGAVLGDRIRMTETGTDPGVFIRSMATRGHAGGLALATFDAVRVLDALGMDLVFVETVGAGQSEVEIASRAHTTVVVEMPLTGDAIQVMKAGILEIGDVYVVNKVDLGNWENLVANLKFQIEERDGWRPPIVKTSALKDQGTEELADTLDAHWAYLLHSDKLRARNLERAKHEILENAQRLLANRVSRLTPLGTVFDRLAGRVAARKEDPHTAAKELFAGAARAEAPSPRKRRASRSSRR